MMKSRLFLTSAISAAMLALGGCAATGGLTTVPQAVPLVTLATNVCTIIQPTITNVQMEATLLQPPLTEDQQAQLDTAQARANAFCSTVSTVGDAQDVQGMMDAVFPVISNVVANSSLDAKDRNALLLSIVGVKTAADVIMAQQKAAAKSSPEVPQSPVEAPIVSQPAQVK